jgi:hypothetical protein
MRNHYLPGDHRLADGSTPDEDTHPGVLGPRQGCPHEGGHQARIRQHLLALAVCLALSLLFFGPQILTRMSSWLLSDQPQDASIFVWMLRWWPYAIGHHIDPLFTTAAWAPGGINLAWVTSVPALGIVMAPVTQAFGPVFAFNVAELAAPALTAWTGYLLCRRITGAFWPALAGGLLFGFSPDLISEVGQGHPNLTLTFLIPLAGYLAVRLLEGSIRARWAVPLLGLVLAVQLYLSTEVFATLTLVGGLLAIVGYALGDGDLRRRLRRAAALVAGGYAVAAVLGAPLLYVAFTRPRPYKPVAFTGLTHGVQSAADFLGYVLPGRFTVLGEQFGQRWGHDGDPWYLGGPLILLLILFLITERRHRSTWVLAVGLVLTLLLSLGSTLAIFGAHVLPWRALSAIPVLHRAQPGRMISYVFLLAGIAVAIWLARPARHRLARWVLAVAALLVIMPNATGNVWARQVPVPPLLTAGGYHRYLTPGETVWVVAPYHSRQMVWQATTGFSFRLAGGFFGVTPPGLHRPGEQAILGTGSVTGARRASIRAFLRSHQAGAVLMAEEPTAVVHAMAQATGVPGVRQGGMVVFQLHRAPGGHPAKQR